MGLFSSLKPAASQAVTGGGAAGPAGDAAESGATRRLQLIAGSAAAVAAVAALAPKAAAAAPAAAEDLRLEVCCDGRTFKLDNGVGGGPTRGSAFIVSGRLYPAGTFAKGKTGPDTPGSVGTWVCRGHFNYDLGDIAKGATPHVATTQYYVFNDGSMLVSDGMEGGQWVQRAVTGGTGKYTGAAGICTEEEVAENDTKLELAKGLALPAPNIVFNFRLS